MDPPTRPNTAQAEQAEEASEPASSGPGNTFLERLATFFEDNDEGACKWPSHLPTPEDMAAAGFILNPTGTLLDNTTCILCNLQCFEWKSKDNPYDEHAKNNPDCSFVLSKVFAKFRGKFRAKRRINARKSPNSNTAADDGITPKILRRRKKNTLTKVQTVADLEPVAVFVTPTKPMRIQISSGGVSMDLTVNGSDVMETPTKKRRYH
ncbi:hypothetical protein F5X68DRAFT_236453 [Plectosphaerella plurivora]|uniref:Uncharacterized protein n=1 Tax=Plectosphaerella plurivora TaxID=936078 RepID=A0A9P9A7V1_9PEZI|nr:hypothetical protein F5X68DRAFT_236453 [Plectosphaerella plurivora]